MRLAIRLLAAIWVSSLVILAAFTFVQIQSERDRLLTDLERRAWLLGEGLKEAIEPALRRGSPATVERIMKKFGTPRRGIAVYDQFASLLAATPDLALPSLPGAFRFNPDESVVGVQVSSAQPQEVERPAAREPEDVETRRPRVQVPAWRPRTRRASPWITPLPRRNPSAEPSRPPLGDDA